MDSNATGVNVSAEAALTQVGQLACFRQLDNCTGWPTRVEVLGALPYRFFNLSERPAALTLMPLAYR